MIGGAAPAAVTRWLLVGVSWVLLGLVWMPSGPSLNPGHAFNLIVAATLYLPVLLQLLWRRESWRTWLRQSPTLRLSLWLMAWAALSVCWAKSGHRGQAAARTVSVLALIGAWQYLFAYRPTRALGFLRIGGGLLAVSALLLTLQAWLDGQGLHRLTAVGVLGNANSSSAVMGAACLWLSGGKLHGEGLYRWRGPAMAVLVLFMVLSQARAALAGLLLVAVLALIERRGRALSRRGCAALVLAAAAGIALLYLVGRRGLSLRPQIAEAALNMIGTGPWYGLGQGSEFLIQAGRQTMTHSHNLVTQTVLLLGLPGLLLLLLLLFSAGRTCLRWRSDDLGRLCIWMSIYAAVVTQFDLPGLLESPHPSWILLWIPVANVILLEGADAEAGSGLAGTEPGRVQGVGGGR